MLLVPSLSWGSLADEEITIKCEVEWVYDMKKGEEVKDYSLESRFMQIGIYEPMTILIKIQHTNDLWWEGEYSSDTFYASHDDPEDKSIKFDFIVEIDRLTGQYSFYKYTHNKTMNKKYGFHESGICKKSSTLF